MAHQPLAAVFGLSVGVAAEEGCDLRLDGLRQQGSRALAQNFGERVGERGWLDQLDDIILDHDVSLLWWRSGGLNTPTIRRLNPSRRHQLPRIALDWNLDLWRCQAWDKPLCSIYEFDGSQRVRDGCTRCMIDCYRDSSVMQQIGVSVHDAYTALRAGKMREAAAAIGRTGNLGSVRAVLEELPWLIRF